MFFKHSSDGKIVVLIVYVDDIILTGDDEAKMINLKNTLSQEFEIKDLGALRYFLGMEVARTSSGISVSQWKYVLDLERKLVCLDVDQWTHLWSRMASLVMKKKALRLTKVNTKDLLGS